MEMSPTKKPRIEENTDVTQRPAVCRDGTLEVGQPAVQTFSYINRRDSNERRELTVTRNTDGCFHFEDGAQLDVCVCGDIVSIDNVTSGGPGCKTLLIQAILFLKRLGILKPETTVHIPMATHYDYAENGVHAYCGAMAHFGYLFTVVQNNVLLGAPFPADWEPNCDDEVTIEFEFKLREAATKDSRVFVDYEDRREALDMDLSVWED